MKTIIILLAGIGDRSYEVLNQRTPLQAAATPNLDRLAFLGSNGLFHATMPGQCLPSEIAHFLLFGYELNEFPGRGLLEAAGGCLGLLRGQELMLTILNHLNRSAMLGHRLGAEERYYFPRTYEPFKLTE